MAIKKGDTESIITNSMGKGDMSDSDVDEEDEWTAI